MSYIPDSELVINPDSSVYHLNLQADQVADTILVVGDPARVAMVSKYFDEIECKVQKREFITHTGHLNGKRLTVISSGIGTDNIDIVLTELDALANIDFESRAIKKELTSFDIIRIGTSGSLQKEVPEDSFVFSSHGLGLDCLMNYYQFQNKEKEGTILEAINNQVNPVEGVKFYLFEGSPSLLEQVGQDGTSGITATCPGFYGPQGRSLRVRVAAPNLLSELGKFEYSGLRIVNFEMETGAIYGLARMLGHRALSCNAIIANRVTKAFSKDPKRIVDKLIRHVLERITE